MHPSPVRSAADAMSRFAISISRPLTFETLAMYVDTSGFAGRTYTVPATVEPDLVLTVVETFAIAGAARPDLMGLAIASVRPGGGLLDGDHDRWFAMAALAEDSGLLLLDWFVIGMAGTISPAAQLGLGSRWGLGG